LIAAFFFGGTWAILPPPPLDLSRAMLAAFLVMIALIFFVLTELIQIYIFARKVREEHPSIGLPDGREVKISNASINDL
jgi:hypothetical protein